MFYAIYIKQKSSKIPPTSPPLPWNSAQKNDYLWLKFRKTKVLTIFNWTMKTSWFQAQNRTSSPPVLILCFELWKSIVTFVFTIISIWIPGSNSFWQLKILRSHNSPTLWASPAAAFHICWEAATNPATILSRASPAAILSWILNGWLLVAAVCTRSRKMPRISLKGRFSGRKTSPKIKPLIQIEKLNLLRDSALFLK